MSGYRTSSGRRVSGYRQGYRSRSAVMADAGVGLAVSAATVVSIVFDLAGLVVNITGMLLAAIFGARWTYRNRHAIRLARARRKARRVFAPKQRGRITRRPPRRGDGHHSAPWSGDPAVWNGQRHSGEWRIHDDGRTIERIG